MLYIKNKLLNISFNTRPYFNIHIIGFINGKVVIKPYNYTYDVLGKCNYIQIKDYINNILSINYEIKNIMYKCFINGIVNVKENVYEDNIIEGKLINNENEYKKDIEGKLNLIRHDWYFNYINGRLYYEKEIYKKYMLGNVSIKLSKYKKEIEGKLNYIGGRYEKEIQGKLNYNDGKCEKDIEGKLNYNNGKCEKDIDGCMYIYQIHKNCYEFDGTIKDIEKREYNNNVINGRLVYEGDRSYINHFNGIIKNIEINDMKKDIDGVLNYVEGKCENFINVKLKTKNEEYKNNVIEGKFKYHLGKSENDILGRLVYGNKVPMGKYFDGRLSLIKSYYDKNMIDGIIRLEKSEYKKDILGKYEVIGRECLKLFNIEFRIRPKCYEYSIFGRIKVMDELKRDICVKIKDVGEIYNKDIDVKLSVDNNEYIGSGKSYNRNYVIPYEGRNSEINVIIRNVKNEEIMNKSENDIVCIIDGNYVNNDITVNLNLLEEINGTMDVYINKEKKYICDYYKNGYCFICLDDIKMCNNSVLCGTNNKINIVNNEIEFEKECEYYELCEHCIMEYEKRKRNEKRRYDIHKKDVREIMERKSGNMNLISYNVKEDIQIIPRCIKYKQQLDQFNINKINNNQEQLNQLDNEKIKIVIYVDPLWVVDPYVFKSSLITVLERYYNKCDLYVTYGGNVRTDFDVMDLCLNYKIQIEKIKRIENSDIEIFIKESILENDMTVIGKVYIFMNDPYNVKNNIKIRKIINVCKYMNIDVVCIGSAGEYMEIPKRDNIENNKYNLKKNERNLIKSISTNDNRIVY